MTEQESFLEQIREDPEDDTVRHVYADWLQEHDQADYAEFIRVQCELEPIRGHLTGVEWLKHRERRDWLLGREATLLGPITDKSDKVCSLWPGYGPLKLTDAKHQDGRCVVVLGNPTPGPEWRIWGFVHRGFVARVELRIDAFCGRPLCAGLAAWIFRHPITSVSLVDRLPDIMFENPDVRLWHLEDPPNARHDADSVLAPELFALLPPSLPSEYPGYEWVGADEKAAYDALSAACVRYGREEFKALRR